MAEGFFNHQVLQSGLVSHLACGSAGMTNMHSGEPPHTLSIKAAGSRGVNIASQIARQVKFEDFQEFDIVLGMDTGNVRQLNAIALSVKGMPQKAKVHLFMEFAGLGEKDIPDPWGKTERDYEMVANMFEASMPLVVSMLTNR